MNRSAFARRWTTLLIFSIVLFAFDCFAQATTGAPAQPSFTEVLGRMMPMFIIVFFIFYFMVLKPQQAKLKAQQELINSLKKGDQVVTSGGLFGRVAGTEKDHILVEFAPNVRVRVEPGHVLRKIDESAADKKTASNAQ